MNGRGDKIRIGFVDAAVNDKKRRETVRRQLAAESRAREKKIIDKVKETWKQEKKEKWKQREEKVKAYGAKKGKQISKAASNVAKGVSKNLNKQLRNRKLMRKRMGTALDLRGEVAGYKSRYFKGGEVSNTNFLFN